MDDLLPQEFDVPGFIRIVSIGAGDGRISSAVAARSASNLFAATEALQDFAKRARSSSSNVIGTYLGLVPQATQVFAPLWLADKHPAIANAALDVLLEIAYFARAGDASQEAVSTARSVVKDVVKGRAPNVFHVVRSDKKWLGRKVLILLEEIASSHRILAKEIVHQFDLTSVHFVKALCNKYNRICRGPFIKLVTTLLKSGDYDLVWYLSTRGRDVLVYSAAIVTHQTAYRTMAKASNKANDNHVGEEQDAAKLAASKRKSDASEADELSICISFLNAVRDIVLTCPNENTVRSALEPPFIDHLATVATSEVESTSDAWSNEAKRKTLCDISASLFMQIGRNRKASKSIFLARALSPVPVTLSASALNFVLDFLKSCPRVANPLLQNGPYLPSQPSASSTWLSQASVIMLCVKSLTKPTAVFNKNQFFERTLNHDSALVQHIGMLVLAVLCRLVEQDKPTGIIDNPLTYDPHEQKRAFLPPLRMVEKLLRRFPGDRTVHSIYSSYRILFVDEFMENNTDAIRMTVDNSGGDISVAESTVRACLASDKESALKTIFQKKMISSLITAAWATTATSSAATKIWDFVRYILRSTDLFPAQSEHEIELWLAALDSQAENREFCLQQFEQLVQVSWKQPYALFDDVLFAQCGEGFWDNLQRARTSLFTAAGLRKFKKLNANQAKDATGNDVSFANFLGRSLTSMVSWDFLVGREYISALILTKLEPTAAARVLLAETKKTRKQLGEAVDNLRALRRDTSNFESSSIIDLTFIGELLMCLYDSKGQASAEELCTFWSIFCSVSANIQPTAPIGISFFEKHWKRLLKHEAEHEQLIAGFLRLLCVRHITSGHGDAKNLKPKDSMEVLKILVDERLPLDEKCALLSLFLRNDKLPNLRSSALVVAMQIISGTGQPFGQDVGDVLLESVLKGINTSTRIDQTCAQCIVSNLVDNFRRFEKLQADEVISAWAHPIVCVLEALVNHSEPASQAYVAQALEEIGAEKRAMLTRIGVYAWKPFASVLERISCMAMSAIDVIVSLDANAIRSKSDAFLPLLTILMKRNDLRLSSEFLTELALGGSWGQTSPAEHLQRRDALKRAFDFAGVIASQQFTNKSIEAVLKHGPPDSQLGASKIWWAIVAGLLSKDAKGPDPQESAANLLMLISRQLSGFSDCTTVIHYGPLHVVSSLLQLAPASTSFLSHHTDAYENTKNLCNFVHSIFKTVGVLLLTSIRENLKSDTSHVEVLLLDLSVILQCVQHVCEVPELAVSLNRLVLHHFGSFSECFSSIGNQKVERSQDYKRAATSVLSHFTRIVGKTSRYLHRTGMDARSGIALTKIEQVFSHDSFVFSASISSFDRDVIDAMTSIRKCLKKDDFRHMKGLPDERGGLFAPLAANVIPILQGDRLKSTSFYVLRRPVKNMATFHAFDPFDKGRGQSYDPLFVLRVLRISAEYAAYVRSSAVIDLGRIANGGLLRVAISALASDDDLIRTEAYAAVAALRNFVGPEFGDLRGSAAALYRDRRPLSFMLNVLNDSIEEPLQKILPLFTSWFYHSLRILLRPTHGAYTVVMKYMLRQPVLNAKDCEGIVNLLRSIDTSADIKSTRYLALEMIQDGMWSRNDHHIARRRKLYENIMLLLGSTLGICPAVRDKAAQVVATIPHRFPFGHVSLQLCRVHRFSVCIRPQSTDAVENRLSHVLLRFDALKAVAASLPKEHEHDEQGSLLANSFRLLVHSLENEPEHITNITLRDIGRILDCAMAVSQCARNVRQLHSFDMPLLDAVIESAAGSVVEKEKCRNSLASVLIQNEWPGVDFSFMKRIWDSLSHSIESEAAFHDEPVMRRRSMVESFVARFILHMGKRMSTSDMEHAVFETARVLSTGQFTVWTIVSAVGLLCGRKKLPSAVMDIADLIPGEVPNRIDLEMEKSFKDVNQKFGPQLLKELVEFGTFLRKEQDHDSKKKDRNVYSMIVEDQNEAGLGSKPTPMVE